MHTILNLSFGLRAFYVAVPIGIWDYGRLLCSKSKSLRGNGEKTVFDCFNGSIDYDIDSVDDFIDQRLGDKDVNGI